MLGQRCKACWQRDKFNFDMPDEIWEAVVPRRLQNRVVCLACFDEFARRKGIDYAPYLKNVLFIGDRAMFNFEITNALTIDNPRR